MWKGQEHGPKRKTPTKDDALLIRESKINTSILAVDLMHELQQDGNSLSTDDFVKQEELQGNLLKSSL